MIIMYSFDLESNNILDIRVAFLQGNAYLEMNDYTGLNIQEHRFFEVGQRSGLALYSAELEPDEMAQVTSSTLLRDAIFENDWSWEDLGMVLHVLAERSKRKLPT